MWVVIALQFAFVVATANNTNNITNEKLYILIKVTSAMHCMLLVVINCQLFRETLSALMVLNAFWTGGTGKLQNFKKKIPNKKTKSHKLNQLKVHFRLSITLADA